jgi:hypothetical protein
MLTPTALQKWVGRSYFGKGDDKFPKGDWKAEKDALMAAIQAGSEGAAKAEVAKEPAAEVASP